MSRKWLSFIIITFALIFFIKSNAFSQQVSATRELLTNYTPGATYDVKLKINVEEGNEPSALIVTETPPPGWSIISATPMHSDPDGAPYRSTYSWLFHTSEVVDMTITYTVSVPPTTSGVQTFAGRVKYTGTLENEIDEPITGDTSILTTTPSNLSTSPSSLNFGSTQTALQFSVKNTGGPTLNWQATTTVDWLSITKYNGSLGSGETELITANINRLYIASGTHNGNINIFSNGGNSTIPVTMVVGAPVPVTNFNAFSSLGGILLVWDNPTNYTGTIIFRKMGTPMTSNPQDGTEYNTPELPPYFPYVGGGTCIFKDNTGLNFYFDPTTNSQEIYYRIYCYSDKNYSTGLQSNSTPSSVLYSYIIDNLLNFYNIPIIGTNTFLDDFEVIIPANSLTGITPAELNFGYIDPKYVPPHPGLIGFANTYGLSTEDIAILRGRKIRVKIPVHPTDLDIAGVIDINDLKVYQWNTNTREWTELTITERTETVTSSSIGFITAEVTNLGKINFFSFGTNISTPKGGNGGGCFIATAVYGTEMAKEVISLKRFRDQRLLTNRAGKAFVRWYYRHSPPVADYIRDKGKVKTVVRVGLQPLLWFANRF